MIKIYDMAEIAPEQVLNRDDMTVVEREVEETVAAILRDVRDNGDEALLRYGEKFDRVKLTALEVSPEEIATAVTTIDEEFMTTLTMARDNIAAFHAKQTPRNYMMTNEDGAVLGQKYLPMEKAGIYVPGGTAAYPSSVLMNAVPAKLAGVAEIVMVTPPLPDGSVAPVILAAAQVAGIARIFKLGGAQAVAALAYGTASVPKVDKIVGPGNIYVATAKRQVFGLVDIDMIAGPSEILVIADATADPAWVAADMLSQAEHDKLATAVLVTTSRSLASAVAREIEEQLKNLPREKIARSAVEEHGKILIANSIKEALDLANAIAPEHLELAVDEPFALLNDVKHAGSIFMGKYAPEALGDYFAGPNHILPTGGTARFSSPLSVTDFIKASGFLYYPRPALAKVHARVEDFAKREGLDGHARSVAKRFQ